MVGFFIIKVILVFRILLLILFYIDIDIDYYDYTNDCTTNKFMLKQLKSLIITHPYMLLNKNMTPLNPQVYAFVKILSPLRVYTLYGCLFRKSSDTCHLNQSEHNYMNIFGKKLVINKKSLKNIYCSSILNKATFLCIVRKK